MSETVIETAATADEAKAKADGFAVAAELAGHPWRYGVFHIREVAEDIRPRTVHPWCVIEARP